jgi:Uma2 family endonuclease
MYLIVVEPTAEPSRDFSMSASTKEVAVLGLDSAGALMTLVEFDAVKECDENYRYELIHGVLVVTPPPLEAERDPNDELGYLLRIYQEQHPRGATLDKTLPEQTVRTAHSRRRADRVIWAGLGRLPDPESDPPTIVVEFVSRGKRNRRRDYQEKRQEYKEAGIGEYWIIDRFRRSLTVFRNHPPKPEKLVFGETDSYRTTLLPGFELSPAKLLALADSWD